MMQNQYPADTSLMASSDDHYEDRMEYAMESNPAVQENPVKDDFNGQSTDDALLNHILDIANLIVRTKIPRVSTTIHIDAKGSLVVSWKRS